MKKLVLLLILLLPIWAFAQETKDNSSIKAAKIKPGTFEATILAGVNGAQIDGDGFGGRLKGFNRLGLNGGGRVLMAVSNKVLPGIELLYSQKGSYRRAGPDNIPGKYQYVLDYVVVPVMIGYLVEDRVMPTAGFFYGQLVRSKAFRDGNVEDAVAGAFKKADFGVHVGFTIYFDAGKHFGLDARFEYSFLDNYKGNLAFPGQSAFAVQRNKLVSVRLLYRI